ncbi:MAG: hypothetical protein ACFFBD_14285 [Candidatus Hodarchaeota archaeon]
MKRVDDFGIRVTVIIAGVITVLFGIWHFFVPWLYSWYGYMAAMPDELINTITTTNFFFSISLVLFGITVIAESSWQWQDKGSIKIVLTVTSILWVIRVVCQIAWPQGAMIGIHYFILLVSALTALCL